MSDTGQHDFEIKQGATFTRTLTISDDGTARNLTGYTARMSIRRGANDATELLSMTTGNARIAIIALSGVVTLTLTAAETAALTWLRGVYDLELVSGTIVTRILEGAITVSPEVTR